MIKNEKRKMGRTMFKPEMTETATPAGPKLGYSLPKREFR
jgi:hypothetical protein